MDLSHCSAVDRSFSRKEIARVFLGLDPSEEALVRESARLRKRFQALKEEIRERAREAGILRAGEDDGIGARLDLRSALAVGGMQR
jgi:hypothetical protein